MIFSSVNRPTHGKFVEPEAYRLVDEGSRLPVKLDEDRAHILGRATNDVIDFGDMGRHFPQILRAATVNHLEH